MTEASIVPPARPVVAPWRRTLSAVIAVFNANKTTWLGLAVFLAIAAVALLAPWLAPFDPIEQHIVDAMTAPNGTYWLGSDSFGRDVLSRILWGARISLVIGVSSVALGMVVGSALGILAGYLGGRIDQLIMRAMDVLLSFPTLIMGLLVVAVLGPSMLNLTVAIALTVLPKFARIARAPTIAVKERDYIEACRALGYSDLRIMLVHILPNVLGDILVLGSLWTATAIRIEASLSFIGLGVKPPTPTWGGIIREGFENILDAPWISLYAGMAVLVTVFALNLLGDGLRDAVDPKLRGE
jgi:peptide/nickel transport system permease protein